MKTKQLIYLITMTLSIVGFTGNSFGFDFGGALNSITKELEKGAKELEQGLQQEQKEQPGQEKQPIQQKQQQNLTTEERMMQDMRRNQEEQKRAAEEQRIANEKAEEQRIANEKAAAKVAEAQRIAQEKIAEERRIVEAKEAENATRGTASGAGQLTQAIFNSWFPKPLERNRTEAMDCIGCNISGRIPDNKLTGATLDGANLEGANLQGVSFGNGESYGNDIANLIGTNLKGANLQGANMEYVQLPGANLQGANIEGLILDCGGYIPGSILNSNSDCHISLKNTDFSNTKGFPKNWDTGKYFQTYMIENLNLTGSDMQKKIDAEKKALVLKKENSEADEKAKVAKQLAEVKSGKTTDQQKSFVEIVTTHADKYKNAKNDIKKSISRKKRVTALKALFGGKNTEVGSYVDKTPMEIFKWENDCFDSKCMNHHNPTACKQVFCEAPKNFIPAKRVTDESKYWIGTLSKITTDKDGDATVYINLDNNIKIRNTTGISSSSSMYEQLGELEEGKKIIFNGYFKLHSEGLTTGYFLKTIALTERGALVDPEFDFTFNKIHNVVIGGTASGDTLSKEEMDVEWEKAAEPYKNKDWSRVLQIVKPIAEQGHANAQDLLGLIYSIGQGVPQDDEKSLKWFTKAAKQGHDNSQTELGVMYAQGIGTKKDLKEAKKWFKLAADQGNSLANDFLQKIN